MGVEDRPASAPKTAGPWVSDWVAFGHPDFAKAIAAVSNLLFAFSGTPGEFRDLQLISALSKSPRILGELEINSYHNLRPVIDERARLFLHRF